MKCEPWANWIPGVLSKSQIKSLVNCGYIEGVEDLGKIDYSSLDLHITGEVYKLKEGSVKPSGAKYYSELEKEKLLEKLDCAEDAITLQPKDTYLFKIRERLTYLDGLSKAKIYGQATAKSSVGRVDVLARLIIDGAHSYEGFTPEELREGNGTMYLEITPITFPVMVKEGISLTQLRLFLGSPENVQIKGSEVCKSLLKGEVRDDGTLSVDLSPTKIGGLDVVAFWAADNQDSYEPIKLWKPNKADPCNYWKVQTNVGNKRLKMEKEAFYILRSKERIALQKGIAVYCKAIDETIGEMRIHYAGFVHPFFGLHREDGKEGTPLIFEVRVHNTLVSLKNGEKLARLIFYRMSEDAEEEEEEEEEKEEKEKTSKPEVDYNDQELQLSNFFDKWPDELELNDDNTVKPLKKKDEK